VGAGQQNGGTDAYATAERDELFRNVFSRAPVPQCTVDLEGNFMHINPAGCELIGYHERELVGRSFLDVADPEGATGLLDAFLSIYNGDEESISVDATLVRKDGIHIETEIYAAAVHDVTGDMQYFVALAHDVTERRRTERQYRHLAAHDHLTELPNRAWFTQRVGQAVSRSQRTGSMVGLYFVDLDDFKPVNDRFGHDAGDQVLFTLAGRLDRVVRPGDTVARYGGDEFTILCEDLPGQLEAIEIAHRILEAIRRRVRLSEGDVTLSASVGVVLAHSEGLSPSHLISAADKAMYNAKDAGKGTYRLVQLP
jgi:diguanylate cyclase (GGDEF)-like protein/PAS domain S-box-containing protein